MQTSKEKQQTSNKQKRVEKTNHGKSFLKYAKRRRKESKKGRPTQLSLIETNTWKDEKIEN